MPLPNNDTYPSPDIGEVQSSPEQPHFIRESTLEATLAKVAEVSPENRRIIIYAGVHPNEGTAGMAEKYADEWAAKYGALVVCHPTDETPNAIWEHHRSQTTGQVIPPLPKDVELSEDKYEDAFSLGQETFFIRFHGTPLRDSTKPRTLEIVRSMYKEWPDDYQNGRIPLRHSRPEVVNGLESILPNVDLAGYPANVVLVEYYYEGSPAPASDDPYAQALVAMSQARDEKGVPSIFEADDPKWWVKTNIGPSYLTMPVLSPDDEKAFDETFSRQFDTLLNHVASQIPR